MGGELKRTPLHAEHVRLGAKLVNFNQWEMPVQYSGGILKEHEAVRTAAGLFDVSHMGRFHIEGPGAVGFVNHLITNDLEKCAEDQLLYTPVCNEQGGVLDDVTVYRLKDRVLMVANAGNLDRIWDWLGRQARSWTGAEARLANRSPELAQIALQGPQAEEILTPLVAGGDLHQLGYYRALTARVAGVDGVLISRNGYTGEDGFEIYVPAARAVEVWRAILGAGHGRVSPIGLGARDTLRFEMTYCLYGNELTPEITPLEAGLQWTVKLKKNEFIGKDAIAGQKERGLARVLVGFEIAGNRLARHGQPIRKDGREIGFVTSGGFCPSIKRGMGLGYVPPVLGALGSSFEVDVRGEAVQARVVQRPFYTQGSHH